MVVSSTGWGELTLTGEQEGDETRLFGHVELEPRAAKHVLDNGFRAPRSLQERQELFGFLCLLQKKESEGEREDRISNYNWLVVFECYEKGTLHMTH